MQRSATAPFDHALPGPAAATAPRGDRVRLDGLTFDSLLVSARLKRGKDIAIRVPGPDRTQHLTGEQFAARVGRLASLLAQVHVTAGPHQPPSLAAIIAPMGRDAAVAMLAALRAGLSPFLVPPGLAPPDLTRLLETTGVEIAIGIDRAGEFRPLHDLREVAARVFGLRCVAGFGADIPDGVVALDGLLATDAHATALPSSHAVRAPFAVIDTDHPERPPETLPEAAVLQAGLQVAEALDLAAGSRLVTTLTGGGLAALATGLAAALLTGAEFMPLGLFSRAGLEQALAEAMPVHLVAPGAIAPALLRAGLASHPAIATLVFVHDNSGDSLPVPDHHAPGQPATGHVRIVDVTRAGPGELVIRPR